MKITIKHSTKGKEKVLKILSNPALKGKITGNSNAPCSYNFAEKTLVNLGQRIENISDNIDKRKTIKKMYKESPKDALLATAMYLRQKILAKFMGIRKVSAPMDVPMQTETALGHLKWLKEKKYKTPKKLRIWDDLQTMKNSVLEQRAGMMTPLNNTVSLIKENFVQKTARIIMHEAGHYNHYKKNKKLFIHLFRGNYQFTPKVQKNINKKVGEEAKNPLEFVAEVFFKGLAGKKFDDEIMGIYNALQGPKINQKVPSKY